MRKGNIVLLNGVSSAGKTTLSKVFQNKLPVPYYRVCGDDFMHMTPPRMLRDDFDSQMLVTQGIMHETIRLFFDRGHNVVVDDVILDLPDKNDWLYDYACLLHGYPALFVNVVCPLDELIRRQSARGDREPGQAQGQLAHAYRDIPYDLTVDTFAESTEQCADKIIARLGEPASWTAFRKIKSQIEAERNLR